MGFGALRRPAFARDIARVTGARALRVSEVCVRPTVSGSLRRCREGG
ncbi:MAG: hypothetical protein BLITH_1491 [Brockia lithotrophica]|uniref:Uncharacterized protein n=1 Tax=Brockia lithotrophica TaxID=933949 RepID=A0A2T5G5E8_9BACL|nr:MAG: hypothetical protein BLITH_1491 [Brockia lithotrophica]